MRSDQERITFYQLLNIGQHATHKEIGRNYHELACKYNPDNEENKGNTVTEKLFIRIAEAYDTLSDAVKRYYYDRGLCIAPNPQPQFTLEKAKNVFKRYKHETDDSDYGEDNMSWSMDTFASLVLGNQFDHMANIRKIVERIRDRFHDPVQHAYNGNGIQHGIQIRVIKMCDVKRNQCKIIMAKKSN